MPFTTVDTPPRVVSHPLQIRQARWWWYPALAVLAALPYAGVFDAQFVAVDDETNITANPNVLSPSWEGLYNIWAQDYFGQYVPLSYTLWAGEAWLAARTNAHGVVVLDPCLFHVVNVVLHALCATLVFAVLRILVRDDVAALLGSLLFAWHPLQVESVAWISEMRGPLAAMFSLAAIYEYLRYRGQSAHSPETDAQPASEGATRSWWHYSLAVLWYGLALLSKLSAASVPLILLALDVIWLRERVWRSLVRLAWWFLPIVVLAWVTSSAQTESISGFVYVPPLWQRVLVALDSVSYYLWKFLVPFGLSLDYGRSPAAVLSDHWIWFTALVPVILLTVMLWSRSRVWLASAAIFVAVAAPVSGIVPRAAQTFSTVADHYVYLGLFGPAWILAWLLTQPRGLGLRREAALCLVLLALLSARQTGYWHDTRALAERMLQINPEGVAPLGLLAKACLAEGDEAQAETYLREAAARGPTRPVMSWDGNSTLIALASFYIERQRFTDAIPVLERSVALRPRDLQGQVMLARIQLARGEHETVIHRLREFLAAMPDAVEARAYLASALTGSGRYAEALEEWRVVLRTEPDNADVIVRLADTLFMAGDLGAARREYERVLTLRPEDDQALKQLELLRQRTDGN